MAGDCEWRTVTEHLEILGIQASSTELRKIRRIAASLYRAKFDAEPISFQLGFSTFYYPPDGWDCIEEAAMNVLRGY